MPSKKMAPPRQASGIGQPFVGVLPVRAYVQELVRRSARGAKKKKKLARKPQGKPRIKTQRHVAVRREEGVTPPRSVRLPVASPGSEPDGKKKHRSFAGPRR